MNEKSSTRLEDILSNKYSYPLVLALSWTAAFLGLFDPVLNAFKRGDLIVGTVYISLFVFVLFVGYLLRPKPVPTQPPQKGIFKGVGKLEIDDAWIRPNDRNGICETIKRLVRKPIILVGSSGVGKSVLLETQVVPSLRSEGWVIVSFSSYDTFKTFKGVLVESLNKIFPKMDHDRFTKNAILEGIDDNTKLLLIYDQFEQFLSAFTNKQAQNEEDRKWFRDFLQSSTELNNIRHVIVVRKEWYYDLRFLEEYIPPPIESVHLSGIKMDEKGSEMLILRQKMHSVTKNPESAEAILGSLIENDEILPVQAQIVGLMLENKVRETGTISTEYYLKELGGKDGLIQSYFQSYLDSSPDRQISMQVLFALSVETRLRSQLSLPNIADIVHKTQKDVAKSLAFFVDQGLVLDTKKGGYELAHDYLAEKFHELSGTELDPVERDNILFFWDEMSKSSKPLDITRPKINSDNKLVFSDFFMIFLGILLVGRLMGPSYNLEWGWFNILNKYQTSKIIDIYYLPVFISHLAWSIYVTTMYRRFFSLLRESTFARLFSKFTVVNCTACVVTAVFIPYFWLLSIGVGGVGIGLKLYQLSKSPGLSKISIVFFKRIAIPTIINLLVVILVGLAIIYYVNAASLSVAVAEQINVFFIFLAMIMTYYMLAVSPEHITRDATSKMLGLIDRGTVRLRRLAIEISK